MFSRLALVAVLAAAVPSAAFAGPPWISIELPANPWDRDTRGAFLVVHTFHHGTVIEAPLTGTAEGIVDGRRRSVTLSFEKTGRPGVYALRNQWGSSGRWVLLISVAQSAHPNDIAQAVVTVSEDGAVTSVRVPTEPGREGNLPRRATAAEVTAALTSTVRP
jgi:hypothetical protein